MLRNASQQHSIALQDQGGTAAVVLDGNMQQGKVASEGNGQQGEADTVAALMEALAGDVEGLSVMQVRVWRETWRGCQ